MLGLPDGTVLTRARSDRNGNLLASIDGVESIVLVDWVGASIRVAVATGTWKLTLRDPRIETEERVTADGAVTTPMPGTVTEVFVETGDTVEPGQALLTIEAMKMILTLKSPCPGQASIACVVGDRVEQGQVLIVIQQVQLP
jgi:biotin carboxyl carrier protein